MHYAQLEQVNKVCPLMSIGTIKLRGQVVYCLGNACQWYDKCKTEDYPTEHYFDWQKKDAK